MAGELNNATINAATTHAPVVRSCPSSSRIRLFVRNQAVYVQLGYGGRGGPVDFDTDPDSRPKFYPPGSYFLDESQRPFDAVKVYAVVTPDPTPPALPASVTLDCVGAGS